MIRGGNLCSSDGSEEFEKAHDECDTSLGCNEESVEGTGQPGFGSEIKARDERLTAFQYL